MSWLQFILDRANSHPGPGSYLLCGAKQMDVQGVRNRILSASRYATPAGPGKPIPRKYSAAECNGLLIPEVILRFRAESKSEGPPGRDETHRRAKRAEL